MSEEINKAESHEGIVTRPLTGEKGQPRVVNGGLFIQEEKKRELRMPNRLCTFDKMAEDDAIFNSIDVTNLLVLTALQNGEFVAPTGSSSGKVAAEFLNYCIRNMDVGTWLEASNNACTDLQYGFSLQNIVLKKRKYGPFSNSWCLSKLSPREQNTLYGWVWDKNFREVEGFVQKPMTTQLRSGTKQDWERGLLINSISNGMLKRNYPFVSKAQTLHFRYNPTNNNPQGNSPLTHCYDAWMEKKLIERYEVIGTSKDLAGSIVLRVPSELVEKANDKVNYPDAYAEYNQLQEDAAKLHAGESSFIVLTSDVDEVTKTKLYDFEIKGIDGGGKQYRTSEIIDQKRKSIYNVFGTGFLLLGQNGVGSHSLSSNQTTTHGQYVNRNIEFKTDVINTQLAPRLLAANNIYLDWKDMPKFVAADPTDPDMDTLGKTIMRMKSVEGMTPSALESLYKSMGLPTEGIEDLNFESKGDSRAGESMGTSGTGTSQANTSSSSTNTENKSLIKNLIRDGELILDTETGEPVR